MITHQRKNWPSGFVSFPDVAQNAAEQCDRQEVTYEWYLKNMCGEPLFAFINGGEGALEFGLDPWRLRDCDVRETDRLFVQRKDMKRLGISTQ